MDAIFTTQPHGSHTVTLLEDASKSDDRIYEIAHTDDECKIRILGSELASLLEWWTTEKDRPGEDAEDD